MVGFILRALCWKKALRIKDKMANIFFRRFMILISSLIGLSFFTFSLTLFFPGEELFVNPNDAGPINYLLQYWYYLEQILSANWGVSQARGSLVFQEFFLLFPATLELLITALSFALILGVPLGVLAARKKNKWQDKLIVSSTLVGYSMPIFWWGMILILVFSVFMGITPVASRLGFEYDILPVTGFMLIDTLLSEQPYYLEAFYDALLHLILPTIVLGTIPLAIFTRVTRSSMIDVLGSDYIRSAKGKGLSTSRIIWIHAMRNTLIPIISILGLQISTLLTGTLITEMLFSWPGVGKWLLEAVYRRDYPIIHAGILAVSSLVIISNTLIETTSHLFNPKSRLSK